MLGITLGLVGETFDMVVVTAVAFVVVAVWAMPNTYGTTVPGVIPNTPEFPRALLA